MLFIIMKKLKTKYLPKLLIIIQFVIFYNFLSDNLLAYKNSSNELWKKEIQKLLGFSQSDISGIMDEKTFESLKFFAIRNNISDIFLYREYQDIGVLGFQEYMEKYHEYWLEKLNDRQLLINISNKEYLKNANEITKEIEKYEQELLQKSDGTRS